MHGNVVNEILRGTLSLISLTKPFFFRKSLTKTYLRKKTFIAYLD